MKGRSVTGSCISSVNSLMKRDDASCLLADSQTSIWTVRITLNEEGIHLCASEVFRLLARDDVSPAGICGKAVGGVPIAIGVSLVRRSVRLEGLARARTDEAMEIVNFMYPTLHSLIARDAPKEHGMELALEGGANLSPGDPVAIIDDVASSGKSLIDAVNVVKEAGFAVVWVGCLVDRLEGAREALEAVGYSLRPLFTIDEIRQ